MKAGNFYGAFFALVLSVGAIRAQVQPFEGKRIVDIQYSVNNILAPEDLAKAQPLRKGEPLRAADVARAIDGLFATGDFTDIVAEAEPSGDGVIVRFITTPQWFLGGVTIEGKASSPPNRGQIANDALFASGGLGVPFREEDVNNAVRSLSNLLRSNGFFENKVTPQIERSDEGQQVFITFSIREGKRARYSMPVLQGNRLLSDSTIVRATRWRIPLIHWWRQVTAARTRSGVLGVQNKYQSKNRLSSKVDLTALDYHASGRRVTPHLTIQPGPVVKVEAVEAKISKRKLKRYVPVFQERAVDNDLLVEGQRNLTDYLQSQGYFDAEVDFRVLRPDADTELIQYVISKGERFKVVRIDILGNKYFTPQMIRERMFIAPASFLTLRHGRYSEAFRKKDETNIQYLYQANGFRDAKVNITSQRNYRGKPGDVAVTVNITEGAQWIVENLEVEGIEHADRAAVMKQISSVPGQPFAEVTLASDKSSVLTWYYEKGFPSANFKAAWRPGSKPNRVDVLYAITEGDQQFVRQVITSGALITRPSLIDKHITLKPGDPLSPVEQTNIQQSFYNLGLFATVNTAIQNPDGATDHKYVLYNFQEANRYLLNVGVGAMIAQFGTPSTTTLQNAAGITGVSPVFSFEVSRLNMFGLGQTLSLRGAISSIQQLAAITWLQPRFRNVEGRNLTYTLLYDVEKNVRTFTSRTQSASVQLSQQFSKTLQGLFRLEYRRVSVSDVVIPVLLIPQFLQPVRLGEFSANFVWDRRNNPANPSRGMYTLADFAIAAKYLGSQRSFVRTLVRNASYYKLSGGPSGGWILARQTGFGVITPYNPPPGISAQESVPLPERFFGGGADTLRAFPYNQAGPRDTGAPLVPGGQTYAASGFPLGGNAIFFNTTELRFPFIGENIQGVFFHDMGNVYTSLSAVSFNVHQQVPQNRNDALDYNFDYMVHDVGVGVRYKTPVGPIRFDLAYGINPPRYVGFNGTANQILNCTAANIDKFSYCTPSPQRIGHIQFFFSIGQTF